MTDPHTPQLLNAVCPLARVRSRRRGDWGCALAGLLAVVQGSGRCAMLGVLGRSARLASQHRLPPCPHTFPAFLAARCALHTLWQRPCVVNRVGGGCWRRRAVGLESSLDLRVSGWITSLTCCALCNAPVRTGPPVWAEARANVVCPPPALRLAWGAPVFAEVLRLTQGNVQGACGFPSTCVV